MYQVTFSEQSMRELNRLDKLAQLEAIEPISQIRPAASSAGVQTVSECGRFPNKAALPSILLFLFPSAY